MAQSGVDWSAGLEWRRAGLAGALDPVIKFWFHKHEELIERRIE